MKYLKSFENTVEDDSPQIGDYIVTNVNYNDNKDQINFTNFIKNNIGQVINIDYNYNKICNLKPPYYIVKYKNIPNNIKSWFGADVVSVINTNYNTDARTFNKSEFQYWSPNKKDCEIFLTANKYNL